MAPELATVQRLAIQVGYLAAIFEDMKDSNPKANENATAN